MGGACMGEDPRGSVVNRWSQLHDAANVFVTDGSQMASTSCVNPSMTFMALTARAADHAVKLVKAGTI
jgi:choline dehydrogenase-like flavoprotein